MNVQNSWFIATCTEVVLYRQLVSYCKLGRELLTLLVHLCLKPASFDLSEHSNVSALNIWPSVMSIR
jgi:hypothetical protein